MSACKTELCDETREEIVKAHAKFYSTQIGNRTTKHGEYYEIFEVETESGDLRLKIRSAGSEEDCVEYSVERICKYEDRWIVGLQRTLDNCKSQQTIMQLTGRLDILTPVKEEEFGKIAEYLVGQTNEERWDFSSAYAKEKHNERIKEAWGIDLNRPSNKAAWKALKEPKKAGMK